jgi:adenine-specific DNA methylase
MTIPKDCKRLAEVDFPIAEVSNYAAQEKSIRYGHPATLHMWWARRPLASSRAVLMALLLPDPLDPLCPADFKSQARTLLGDVQNVAKGDAGLRAGLLKFIGDFANWDLASNQQYLNVSRRLVKAAHPDETPLVVDPFTGGGAIPLEALRMGCDAFASDLNPVASLIQKVVLEDIPRYGREKIKVQTEQGEVEANGLSEALKLTGLEIRKSAEKELAQFYPPDTDGSQPIAYIWARTVRCESPNCGAEIPLLRSLWLGKKSGRYRAFRLNPIRVVGKTPRVEFEIFTPSKESEVLAGTVKRANATCPCCGITLPAARVRVQLSQQNGGADVIFDNKGNRTGGAILVAVAILKPGQTGRKYRLPIANDYAMVLSSGNRLKEILDSIPEGQESPIPDEVLPLMSGVFNVPIYGMHKWGDLFTVRQKIVLYTLSQLVKKITSPIIKEVFALIISKYAELATADCPWEPVAECPRKIFSMQALPMQWGFAEGVVTSESSGSLSVGIDNFIQTLDAIGSNWNIGQTQLADAVKSPLPSDSVKVWFTDPPYYFAVPYADLSDFFFVWLKRMLPDHKLMHDPFSETNPLTPKDAELVEMAHWDSARYPNKDQTFFESGMSLAFREGRRILEDDGISCVVFAHKTTEGWEALLTGMQKAGLTITASWPIATEQKHRPRARDSAALATSVHLICRPRPEDAEIGDWSQVSRELPRKVGDWMQRLQTEGVRGADLVFACIGPALEIYSRYSKVVDAEDREIPLGGDPEASEPHLRGYLAYVWETVGRLALEQVLGSGDTSQKKDAVTALEEDARLTALFLWTQQAAGQGGEKSTVKAAEFGEEGESEPDEEDEAPKKKSKGGYSLPFDVVRRFAQPLGIHLPEWENRIINTDKGVVTLLAVKDRARQLFGEEGASAFASEIEDDPSKPMQMSLFAEPESAPKVRGRRKSKKEAEVSYEDKREATTLDRLHAAMLLQKNGQTNALRALLQAESERGSDFMRLANALSVLYPRESEEKRLLDALLVNVRK